MVFSHYSNQSSTFVILIVTLASLSFAATDDASAVFQSTMTFGTKPNDGIVNNTLACPDGSYISKMSAVVTSKIEQLGLVACRSLVNGELVTITELPNCAGNCIKELKEAPSVDEGAVEDGKSPVKLFIENEQGHVSVSFNQFSGVSAIKSRYNNSDHYLRSMKDNHGYWQTWPSAEDLKNPISVTKGKHPVLVGFRYLFNEDSKLFDTLVPFYSMLADVKPATPAKIVANQKIAKQIHAIARKKSQAAFNPNSTASTKATEGGQSDFQCPDQSFIFSIEGLLNDGIVGIKFGCSDGQTQSSNYPATAGKSNSTQQVMKAPNGFRSMWFNIGARPVASNDIISGMYSNDSVDGQLLPSYSSFAEWVKWDYNSEKNLTANQTFVITGFKVGYEKAGVSWLVPYYNILNDKSGGQSGGNSTVVDEENKDDVSCKYTVTQYKTVQGGQPTHTPGKVLCKYTVTQYKTVVQSQSDSVSATATASAPVDMSTHVVIDGSTIMTVIPQTDSPNVQPSTVLSDGSSYVVSATQPPQTVYETPVVVSGVTIMSTMTAPAPIPSVYETPVIVDGSTVMTSVTTMVPPPASQTLVVVTTDIVHEGVTTQSVYTTMQPIASPVAASSAIFPLPTFNPYAPKPLDPYAPQPQNPFTPSGPEFNKPSGQQPGSAPVGGNMYGHQPPAAGGDSGSTPASGQTPSIPGHQQPAAPAPSMLPSQPGQSYGQLPFCDEVDSAKYTAVPVSGSSNNNSTQQAADSNGQQQSANSNKTGESETDSSVKIDKEEDLGGQSSDSVKNLISYIVCSIALVPLINVLL